MYGPPGGGGGGYRGRGGYVSTLLPPLFLLDLIKLHLAFGLRELLTDGIVLFELKIVVVVEAGEDTMLLTKRGYTWICNTLRSNGAFGQDQGQG
jgi:hypothetical protein